MMYFENLYGKDPSEYLKMDLDTLSKLEIKELSFYLWYKFPKHEQLMQLRDEIMSRLQDASTEDDDEDEDVDGE